MFETEEPDPSGVSADHLAELEVAVAEGVKWLDRNYPTWRTAVDVGTLDMDSDCGCVVGQVVGSYSQMAPWGFPPGVSGCDLGFNVPARMWSLLPYYQGEAYRDQLFYVLRDLWIRVIHPTPDPNRVESASQSPSPTTA